MCITISLVDNNSDLQASLARLIESSPGFQMLSRHVTVKNACEELPGQLPDVVLLNCSLFDASGVAALRQLKLLLPAQTKVIVLTVFIKSDEIFLALANGADGYLNLTSSWNSLLQSISAHHWGHVTISGFVARQIIEFFSSLSVVNEEQLTIGELNLLKRFISGFSREEIAILNGFATASVSQQVKGIYKKLQSITSARLRGGAVQAVSSPAFGPAGKISRLIPVVDGQ